MRAAVRRHYGSYDQIEIVDLAPPTIRPDEVLVDVRAAATNPLDWHYLTGTPYLLRLQGGIRKPKRAGLGADFAGVVAEVGDQVSPYRVGDRVFGEAAASFAEMLATKAENMAPMPSETSFEEAAAIGVAGLTALQGLRDKVDVQPGERVLVIGASGGVGTFTVQIAKAFGADVTAVCSAANADFVTGLGADRVVDYRTEPVDTWGDDHDIVFDNVGTYPLRSTRRRLRKNGRYLLVGGPKKGRVLGPMVPMVRMFAMKPFVSQRMSTFVAAPRSEDLRTLADMVEKRQIRVPIDLRFTLEDTAEALRSLGEWRTRGKSVITIPDSTS